MDDWIAATVESLGYVGIALLMALENIFPPFPSEAILGASALAIERGTLNLWPVVLSATLGSTAGNYAWFYVGQKVGYERLRPMVDRYGRWFTIEWEDVERGAVFFRRYGHWVVFILRATPFLRTMISLPAGLAQMPRWKFLVFTLAGVGLWNLLLIFATQWVSRTFGHINDLVSWIVIGTIVLGVIGYVWRILTWKPRAER